MKILFTIGDLNSGGAEKVVATLANNFTGKGHSVGILMISKSLEESFYNLDKNVQLIPLLDKNRKYSIKEKINKIKSEIEGFNPDTVVAFLNYVIVYTYLALKKCSNKNAIKFIVSERNNPKRVPEQLPYRLLRNHIFKKADGCIFQTQEAREYFGRLKKWSVIPNPVFLTNERKRDNINSDILIVGSDKKEKNRSMAFKAFSIFHKHNPQSKLIVVGANSNENEMKLVEKLSIKDSVVFAGKKKNWHSEYINSKMFILSSDFEGMPNALLEACALQIPCISTNCPSGGPKEILQNGKRGILVPVNDHIEMAKQMIALSNDNNLCERYSNINSDLKSKYDEKKISNQWLDFIYSLNKGVD